MQLKLFNTLTKTKEIFTPLVPEKVSMYVCGPTVYSAPHLGNGLSIIVFDVLYRLLIYVYGKNAVTYVRNITDVDDKINNAAKERNISIHEVTKEVTDIFLSNTIKLNCLEPNFQPKVTDNIKEIVEIIELLIKNGFAYESEKHVYFEVSKFNNYGQLAGRKIDELIAGVRIEIASSKRDSADFVLWKPVNDEQDSSAVFDSPWGKGRPGWHIECSAMSHKFLGPDFDIHGGGVDLVFPHHTNEIAQSCGAYIGSNYAKYWVHNGFLTVSGEKMSKSLGNFITISDLLDQGIEGEVIRYHLASSHYRKPVDWNEKAIIDAKKALDNFYRAIDCLDIEEGLSGEVHPKFLEALLDDLNTPNAYAILHELANLCHGAKNDIDKVKYAKSLKESASLIGLLNYSPKEWFKKGVSNITSQEIEILIEQRNKAKLDKKWEMADNIRKNLLEKKIILEDGKDGVTIWRQE